MDFGCSSSGKLVVQGCLPSSVQPPLSAGPAQLPAQGRTHLHVLAQEEGAHVRGRGGGVRLQQLAGGHRLLIILLALPVLQQGLEHMQTVINSTRAQQGSCCGTGDQRGSLEQREGAGSGTHLGTCSGESWGSPEHLLTVWAREQVWMKLCRQLLSLGFV